MRRRLMFDQALTWKEGMAVHTMIICRIGKVLRELRARVHHRTPLAPCETEMGRSPVVHRRLAYNQADRIFSTIVRGCVKERLTMRLEGRNLVAEIASRARALPHLVCSR